MLITIKIQSCGTNEQFVFLRESHKRNLQEENINTSYLTDSYIGFILKMESVSKNTSFGLKMMVKSGLEKIFSKFLHAGDYFLLLHKSAQNHKELEQIRKSIFFSLSILIYRYT